jgi:hypothetical protein
MELTTTIKRIRERNDKWGRSCGHTDVSYQDVKALLACAERLRQYEPEHIALKWLDSAALAD